MSLPTVFPPALQPGDAVRVIAPAGPFDTPLVWRALGWLRLRYQVRYSRGIFSRSGYLAGSDARRLDELQAALAEPGVSAVLCARGGYGLSRIAHRVDWSVLRATPRWLVGFSDVTAIHVEAARQGVASVHGSNATGVGRGDQQARDALQGVLETPAGRCHHALSAMRPGQASGPLFGGNLTLLHACAAAGRLQLPAGCVLFLEDIAEPPYRLDRAISTLLAGGHLDAVSAVVLGQLTHCGGADDARDMLVERLGALQVPIAAGLQSGHDLPNLPLVQLAPALLSAGDTAAALIVNPLPEDRAALP